MGRRTVLCCNDQSYQWTAQQQWLCAFSGKCASGVIFPSMGKVHVWVTLWKMNSAQCVAGRSNRCAMKRLQIYSAGWMCSWSLAVHEFLVFWSRFLICSARRSLLHHKSSDKRLRCDRRSCSARALTFKAKAADVKSNSAKVQMPKRFIFQTSPRIINKLVGLHFINFSSAEKNSHRMGSNTLWQQSIYRFYLVCFFLLIHETSGWCGSKKESEVWECRQFSAE